MWFDVQRALAEIEGAEPPCTDSSDITTREAAQRPEPAPRVAHVAGVARPQPQKPETACSETDPATLLDFLRRNGPSSYGAAASALGWGATRAWQAEARLRAAGLVRHGELGRAYPATEGERE